MITIDDQIKCAQREVAMRKAVFPRQVERGNMSREKMEIEIAIMEKIVHTLMEVRKQQTKERE